MKSITDNLSLQDLLAVLLPGALAVYFLSLSIYGIPIIPDEPSQIDTIALIAPIKIDWSDVFALGGAAYFVGYLFYVLSSCLDSIYDNIKLKALKIKKYGDNGVKPKKGSVWNILFPYLWHTHTLIMIIAKFSQERIGDGYFNKELKIIDSYQFAFRWLMKEKPEMYEEAERYLATARFFRSMVFVWAFGAITWVVKAEISNKWYALILVGLCIVSFFAYLNRWRKAHHVAFKNVIILQGIKNDLPINESPTQDTINQLQ